MLGVGGGGKGVGPVLSTCGRYALSMNDRHKWTIYTLSNAAQHVSVEGNTEWILWTFFQTIFPLF